MSGQKIGGSFRDPSGTAYNFNGEVYRRINEVYRDDYTHLVNSGLYQKLVKLHLLIPHKEIRKKEVGVYRTIKPVQIPFISYPYEWSFSQLKDAALTTLAIGKIAIEYGMILKDATPYNIQFYEGRPILIDTLSFKKYDEGQPWPAYRQFCMHFLAPLLLMAYIHLQLSRLLRVYIEGIPLSVASALLPIRSWLKPSIISHIHIHAKMEDKFGNKKIKTKKNFLGKLSLLGLIDNLQGIIENLNLKTKRSEWSNYYEDNNYSLQSFNYKKKIVSSFINETKADTVWDLGANTGIFSHLSSQKGAFTVSFDSDLLAVERNYLSCKEKKNKLCLPLVFDLMNPSPFIGWEGKERMSIFERGPADTVLALALIHHLAIGNNVPFEKIGNFLSRICNYLIIEFIPKEDSQVQILLQNRSDIFPNYNRGEFESVFKDFFIIEKIKEIPGSKRLIYLMSKRKGDE